MSSRPILQPMPVITNGSLAGNLTSLVTIISNMSMMSYAYTWTGTSPVGVITVQVSDDYAQNVDGSVKTIGIWNNLPLSATPAVNGNVGQGFIDIDQLGAYAIRTVYTAASGTGTLNAIFKGKVS